jgi:hypothetical protein
MADRRRAPSVNDVINKEKIKEEERKVRQKKYDEEAIQRLKEQAEKQDSKIANEIIDRLEELFERGLVSSKEGCHIFDILSDMSGNRDVCSENILKKINNYLGGEWIAVFKRNTGSHHDDYTTNTLIVTPIVTPVK